MTGADLDEARTALLASLAELRALPAGMSSVEDDVKNTASALIEICALQAGTRAGWDVIDRYARHVAGIRPEQAAATVDVLGCAVAIVAGRAAVRSGRPAAEHVDDATGLILGEIEAKDPEMFAWVVAALTIA